MTIAGAATKLPNTNGLSAISPFQSGAGALAGLVMVSPQHVVGYLPQFKAPDSFMGPPPVTPSLLFHYEGEQTILLESDITDHYVEDNTAVQDQIALRPEVVTVHGYVGELNDVTPSALAYLKTAADKLQTVSAYAPGFSVTALLAYNVAFSLYQTAMAVKASAVSAWDSYTGQGGENVINAAGLTDHSFRADTGAVSNNQNAQQTMFQQFYGYWRARTLFTVQTPWAVFKDMAIKSLRAIQDETTNQISDFEVQFKMIRNAKTLLEPETTLSDRLDAQASDLEDGGVSSPTDTPGFMDKVTSLFGSG